MFMFVSRVLLLLAPLAVAAQVPAPQASGLWEGAINAPSGIIQVVVRLDRSGAGEWSGTIDIPAQGAKALTLANIAVDGPSVHFSIAGVPGGPTFAGTLSNEGSTILGDFTQGPAKADIHAAAQHDGNADGGPSCASTGTEAALPVRRR